MESKYDEETRAYLNEILEGLANFCGDPFGLVSNAFDGVSIDPVEMFQEAFSFGMVHLFLFTALRKKGVITGKETRIVADIIDDLMPVLVNAAKGDKLAKNQLDGIQRCLQPQKYRLRLNELFEFNDKHHTRPALARAWAIRRWIGALSCAVEPANANSTDIHSGPVKLRTPPLFNDWKTHRIASKHWTRGVYLKTLAIRAYKEELEAEGIEIETRNLQKDLDELGKWEKSQPEPHRFVIVIGGNDLPFQDYSEGWKQPYQKEVAKRGM